MIGLFAPLFDQRFRPLDTPIFSTFASSCLGLASARSVLSKTSLVVLRSSYFARHTFQELERRRWWPPLAASTIAASAIMMRPRR